MTSYIVWRHQTVTNWNVSSHCNSTFHSTHYCLKNFLIFQPCKTGTQQYYLLYCTFRSICNKSGLAKYFAHSCVFAQNCAHVRAISFTGDDEESPSSSSPFTEISSSDSSSWTPFYFVFLSSFPACFLSFLSCVYLSVENAGVC